MGATSICWLEREESSTMHRGAALIPQNEAPDATAAFFAHLFACDIKGYSARKHE